MNRLRSDILVYALALIFLVGAISVWWRGVWPASAGDDGIIVLDDSGARLSDVGLDMAEDVDGAGVSEETPPAKATIIVHVAGAVARPGVYELVEGQRVHEAVELAGARSDADLDLLNLAAILRDSDKIYVPKKGEAVPAGAWAGLNVSTVGPGSGTEYASVPRFPININTAGASELDALPGIGPSLANAIIAYRNENGPFGTPRDIIKVRGIGEKTYEKFRDLIVTK